MKTPISMADIISRLEKLDEQYNNFTVFVFNLQNSQGQYEYSNFSKIIA